MFRRMSCLLAGLILSIGYVGAAQETDDPWIRGVFTGKSPRAVQLTESDAWQRASTVA